MDVRHVDMARTVRALATKINPNAKVPAVVQDGIAVFDSHAILLYLAEKHAGFIPRGNACRATMLSWLQFVATGLSPFSGQAIHFLHHAREDLPYAKNRYVKEIRRRYQVLESRLAKSEWLAGDEYTIADIAMWGWVASAGYIFGDEPLSAFPYRTDDEANVSAVGGRKSARSQTRACV
jgi:GST-like protein